MKSTEFLDKPTLSPTQIAKKHNVSLIKIKKALEQGIKVEQEHTSDLKIAREIALDHLSETPDYYDKLKTIEKDINEDIINEGATDILYHYTSLQTLDKILKSNKLKLTADIGSDVENAKGKKGYPFFLSTTRSKVGDYHKYVGRNAVMLVLDGQYYSQRYPVKPIDYWDRMWQASLESPHPYNWRTRESEDRIFSKTPSIPIDGIKAAHILIDSKKFDAGYILRRVILDSKKRNIDIYVYDNENAWRLQNTRKSLGWDDIKNIIRGVEPNGYYRRSTKQSAWLYPWLELIYKKDEGTLTKKAKDLLYKLSYYGYEQPKLLANDLFNTKMPSRDGYDVANKVIEFMRKNKMQTPTDLVNFVMKKWNIE